MRKKQFLVEQMALIQQRAELVLPVADLILLVGISEPTLRREKIHYTGFESDRERELTGPAWVILNYAA